MKVTEHIKREGTNLTSYLQTCSCGDGSKRVARLASVVTIVDVQKIGDVQPSNSPFRFSSESSSSCDLATILQPAEGRLWFAGSFARQRHRFAERSGLVAKRTDPFGFLSTEDFAYFDRSRASTRFAPASGINRIYSKFVIGAFSQIQSCVTSISNIVFVAFVPKRTTNFTFLDDVAGDPSPPSLLGGSQVRST
jgi:hypothetical protein